MDIPPYYTIGAGAILLFISIFVFDPGNVVNNAVPLVVMRAMHFLGSILIIVGIANWVGKFFKKRK